MKNWGEGGERERETQTERQRERERERERERYTMYMYIRNNFLSLLDIHMMFSLSLYTCMHTHTLITYYTTG